jgi:hypothetical protein
MLLDMYLVKPSSDLGSGRQEVVIAIDLLGDVLPHVYPVDLQVHVKG